jgi:transposase
MAKKYRVTLTVEERDELERMISRGKSDARVLARSRALLLADESGKRAGRTDDDIATALNLSLRTVERLRQRFVEEGFSIALRPKPAKRVYRRLLDGRQEAKLIALACSKPPKGKRRWTLRLLAEQMVELRHAGTVSHETVRQTLKKTNSSRI